MNKKEFIKNKPLDVNDVNQMLQWVEDSHNQTVANMFSPGVLTGLGVTANATGLRVDIAPGKAYDSNFKLVSVGSTQIATLTTADANNPRIDLITVKFNTSTVNNTDTGNIYGYGTSFIYSKNILDSFTVQVVKGTAAASPVAPALPDGNVLLAEVTVPKLATSLNSSNITDKRTFYTIGDAQLNQRLLDDTFVPAANNLYIGEALSGLANRIKAITGKSDWKATPAITLDQAVKKNGDTLSGTYVFSDSPKITYNKPIINAANSNDKIGFGINGASDNGIQAESAAVLSGGNAVYLKFNNYWDGTSDKFIRSGYKAAQFGYFGSGSLQTRGSTNTATTAGEAIVWGGTVEVWHGGNFDPNSKLGNGGGVWGITGNDMLAHGGRMMVGLKNSSTGAREAMYINYGNDFTHTFIQSSATVKGLTVGWAQDGQAMAILGSTHAYMSFFPKSNAGDGTRYGYIGVPDGASNHIIVAAEQGELKLRAKTNSAVRMESKLIMGGPTQYDCQIDNASYISIHNTGFYFSDSGDGVVLWKIIDNAHVWNGGGLEVEGKILAKGGLRLRSISGGDPGGLEWGDIWLRTDL